MGWREVLGDALRPTGMTLNDLVAFFPAMPPADRIALARELLPAGAVVAWDVGEELSPEHGEPDSWQWGFYDGWNACRAAMLADPDA